MVNILEEQRSDGATVHHQFTPESATQTLPLIRRIADDMRRLNLSIESLRVQLQGVEGIDETNARPEFLEELNDIRGSLAADEMQLQACLRELAMIGVQPHPTLNGAIDFPAKLDNKSVSLCWNPDDDSVTHWHEPGQSPQQRQPIDRI